MIRATRTCILVMVIAFLAQVESGYDYQVPGVPFEQPYHHLANAGTSHNTHPSVSHSMVQGNYIKQQNNGQYLHSNYQNRNSNNYNGFGNNIQSGIVLQNVQQTNPNSVQPIQPVITKHIYFHVPPPDEDIYVRPPLTVNRKKTYNLVFIKVPSQKPKYFVNSQEVQTNPYAAVEDKTLIYVLVKNPLDQLQVPKQSPPNHEVFYVKYKGSASSAASQINSDVSQQQSVSRINSGVTEQNSVSQIDSSRSDLNSVQSLRPGLINGL